MWGNVVILDFEGSDGSIAPVGVATYDQWIAGSTGSGRRGANVLAAVVTVGATCDWNSSAGAGGFATGGSVSLTTSSSTQMAGSFTLSFADPAYASKSIGHVSGSFDAPLCTAWFTDPGVALPPCQ